MTTCGTCKYFGKYDYDGAYRDLGAGECHYEPPRIDECDGGSYRPRVEVNHVACSCYDEMPVEQVKKSKIVAVPSVFSTSPLKTITFTGNRRFCFEGQSASVRNLLQESGLSPRDIEAVEKAEQLHGRKGGTFFSISGHECPVPAEMINAVQASGMVTVSISESWRQERPNESR